MNITQEVVTDLLPVYFSDEASSDTKSLVEEYFRENPDFERMARSACHSGTWHDLCMFAHLFSLVRLDKRLRPRAPHTP